MALSRRDRRAFEELITALCAADPRFAARVHADSARSPRREPEPTGVLADPPGDVRPLAPTVLTRLQPHLGVALILASLVLLGVLLVLTSTTSSCPAPATSRRGGAPPASPARAAAVLTIAERPASKHQSTQIGRRHHKP